MPIGPGAVGIPYFEVLVPQAGAGNRVPEVAEVLGGGFQQLELEPAKSAVLVCRQSPDTTYMIDVKGEFVCVLVGSDKTIRTNVALPRFFVEDIQRVMAQATALGCAFEFPPKPIPEGSDPTEYLGCLYGPMICAALPDNGPMISAQQPNALAEEDGMLGKGRLRRVSVCIATPQVERRLEQLAQIFGLRRMEGRLLCPRSGAEVARVISSDFERLVPIVDLGEGVEVDELVGSAVLRGGTTIGVPGDDQAVQLSFGPLIGLRSQQAGEMAQ